jgi:hypothetical protein
MQPRCLRAEDTFGSRRDSNGAFGCDIYGVETRLLTASSRFLVNGVLIRIQEEKKLRDKGARRICSEVHYKSCCDVGCWGLNMNQSS